MNEQTANVPKTDRGIDIKLPPQDFMRLPKSRQRDPVFGLSRTFLNSLVLPCRENDYRPPVRSFVFKRRGARTGVRLVDLRSLRQYVEEHVEPSFALPTVNNKA